MTISQRIFELLKEKNLKQKQLADYTGISTAAISSWKKLKTNPSSDKIPKICEFLDVSYEYLLTGVEKQTDSVTVMNDFTSDTYGSVSDLELDLLNRFRKLPERDKYKVIGFIEAKLDI